MHQTYMFIYIYDYSFLYKLLITNIKILNVERNDMLSDKDYGKTLDMLKNLITRWMIAMCASTCARE